MLLYVNSHINPHLRYTRHIEHRVVVTLRRAKCDSVEGTVSRKDALRFSMSPEKGEHYPACQWTVHQPER